MSLRDALTAWLGHCIEPRMGFPRVDWDRVFREMPPGIEPGPRLVPLLAEVWLERLRDEGPAGGRIDRSAGFLVLSWGPQAAGRTLLSQAERFRQGVLQHLRGIARDLAPLQLPILWFPDYERYLDFVADGDPDGGEFATCGGRFVGEGFPHVLLPTRRMEELEETLAHELVHAHLAHLDLPPWLDEGFATTLADTLLGRGWAPPADDLRRHRGYFDAATIQGFWSGAAFSDVQGQEHAYALAELLMRTLAKDYPRLQRFAVGARREDAGAEAFARVYGRPLGTLPVGALGPGDWQPEAWRW